MSSSTSQTFFFEISRKDALSDFVPVFDLCCGSQSSSAPWIARAIIQDIKHYSWFEIATSTVRNIFVFMFSNIEKLDFVEAEVKRMDWTKMATTHSFWSDTVCCVDLE